MKLLVLAGGFGTRLQSAVPLVPKALAPIGETPFLRYQIENWIDQGITSIVFLLHHRSNQIVDFIKSLHYGIGQQIDMQWVTEAVPLGTGGAIANAVAELKIRGDFLIANADTWLSAGVAQVAMTGAPSLGIIEVTDAGRYGSVAFDRQKKVTYFMEKNELGGAGWVNAGMALLNSDLFQNKPIKLTSLENDYFAEWVRFGILKAAPLECDFIDIGIPEDYYRFCRWIASKKSEPL